MDTEKISFVERIYQEILVGEKMIVDGNTEVIYDVQFEPKTRQLIIEFTSGLKVTAHKDDEFEFIRDVKRPRIKPNRRL
jgi:hypothetical protein